MIWQDSAACAEVDGDIFFPEDVGGVSTRSVVKICESCPVKDECLELALRNQHEYGIWGGLTPVQRKKLRKGMAS